MRKFFLKTKIVYTQIKYFNAIYFTNYGKGYFYKYIDLMCFLVQSRQVHTTNPYILMVNHVFNYDFGLHLFNT